MKNNFSTNLRLLRRSNNLTLSELADMIGSTRQTISNYENGKREPDLYTLVKISKVFSCSLDDLIFNENSFTSSDIEKLNELDRIINTNYFLKTSKTLDSILLDLNNKRNEIICNIDNLNSDLDKLDTVIEIINKHNKKSNDNSNCVVNINDYSKPEKAYIDIGFYKENDVQIYYPKESNENTYRIPVVGYISAGCPHWAFENISNYLNISKDYLGCYNKYFILKVAGESMNEIYKNKDYILVDGSQNIVSSNTPVIALVDNDEATVKYIYIDHENNTFTLIPKSSDNTFEPITYSFERHSLKILGTVLGVVNYANSIK